MSNENVEVIEVERESGPSLIVERVEVETVKQGGLVTANVGHAGREVVNPATLPTGPLPMPRRRARR